MIDLGNGVTIKPDARCWILSRRITRKSKKGEGSNEYGDHTYHATLAAALRYYVDEEMKTPATAVQELLRRLTMMDEHLEQTFKNVPRTVAKGE